MFWGWFVFVVSFSGPVTIPTIWHVNLAKTQTKCRFLGIR